MPHGGTTKDENYSPPLEGCRGGLSPTGRTHPEGYAFYPSPEGILLRNKSSKQKDTWPAQRGQSLLELAAVLPLLLLIAFGATEFGRAYYQYNTLSKAIRNGGRYMSSHTYSGTEISNAQSMVVYGNTGASGSPVLPGLTPGQITVTPSGGAGPFNEGNPPEWVTVRVSDSSGQGYLFQSIVPGIINLNVRFSPQIKMRYVGPNARF